MLAKSFPHKIKLKMDEKILFWKGFKLWLVISSGLCLSILFFLISSFPGTDNLNTLKDFFIIKFLTVIVFAIMTVIYLKSRISNSHERKGFFTASIVNIVIFGITSYLYNPVLGMVLGLFVISIIVRFSKKKSFC